MSDPIERQAAIDALMAEPLKWDDSSVWESARCHQWTMDMDAIKALSSAQHEPQWIPCSETVDIPNHEILACDKYGEMMFGYLAYEDDQWLCESDGCMMYDPIAWREKPEPYREEGD